MYVYIISAIIAYLVGSISPSYIISSIKKKDMRGNGSGNLGASNTTILLGWKWGVFVGLVDILKAFIPIIIMRLCFAEYVYAPFIVAGMAIVGHIFPLYLKFKGGKGTATFFGSMLGLSPLAFVVIGLVFLLVTFLTDYIVLGTYTVICLFTVYLAIWQDLWSMLIILCAALLIAFKHRKNLVRIIKGEEIGLREALSGKHKI